MSLLPHVNAQFTHDQTLESISKHSKVTRDGAQITVGNSPIDIEVNPSQHAVYVANFWFWLSLLLIRLIIPG